MIFAVINIWSELRCLGSFKCCCNLWSASLTKELRDQQAVPLFDVLSLMALDKINASSRWTEISLPIFLYHQLLTFYNIICNLMCLNNKGYLVLVRRLQFSFLLQETITAWKKVLKGPPKPPKCKGHTESCLLRTVKKKGANYGRQFWVCPRGEGHAGDPQARCDFFQWIKWQVYLFL